MGDSEIISHAMRMVVPVRHEFGRNIDVRRLLADRAYAQETVELAAGSGSDRLRAQALQLKAMLFPSAQGTDTPEVPAAAVTSLPAPSGEDPVLRKYQLGLR